MLSGELKWVLRNTRAYGVLQWWRGRRDVARWERSGRPVPPPQVIKYEAIREYARRYGLRTLVETGTYLGDSIQACLTQFSRIYSIELGDELHRRATRRFMAHRHVSILRGDSAVVLPRIAAELTEPALFWLDGHYSGGITARGTDDTPILAELGAVLSLPAKHVVLIDDIRCFTGDDGYPTLTGLEAFARARRPEYSFAVENDIARLTP